MAACLYKKAPSLVWVLARYDNSGASEKSILGTEIVHASMWWI